MLTELNAKIPNNVDLAHDKRLQHRQKVPRVVSGPQAPVA